MQKHSFYSGKSQVFWTCKALLDGRTINQQTEISEVRGWRLGSIIHRLKHHYGWPIVADYRGQQNVAHYSLKTDTDKTKLRLPRSAQALGNGGAQ